MIKKVFLTVCVILSTALPSWALEFTDYDFNYVTNADNETVTVTGVWISNAIGDYTSVCNIPSTVTYENVTYTVTHISNEAFKAKLKLTSVVIPSTVVSIGEHAFKSCRGIKTVTIGDNGTYDGKTGTVIGYRAFEYCTGLTTVTIGNNVTSIGDDAFYCCTGLTSVEISNSVTYLSGFNGCTGLTSVEIPNSVTEIGGSAFTGCTGLTSVEIPNSVTSIGWIAFSGCTGLTSVEIPNSVTSIGGSAFSGCNGITSLTLGDSVTSIGDNAFSGCTGLTSVEIPNSVTYLSGFGDCTGLTSIEIPNSVTSIGDNAFSGCNGITSLILGDSVTSIGDNAFYSCTGLTSVEIPNSVTSIGGSAFSGCAGITSLTLGDSVTSIGDNAFSGCNGMTSVYITDLEAWCNIDFGSAEANPLYYAKNLYLNNELVKNIIIPNSITDIKNYVFINSSSLASVKIPDTVTSIGDSAFSGCSSLTSLTMGNGVTAIGTDAFAGCEKMKSIISEATTPPTLNSAFSDTQKKNTLLFVPENTSPLYKSAQYWSEIENINENANLSDFEYNGIYYRIISVSDMTVAVAAKEAQTNVYSGDVIIPEKVTCRGREFTVTEIDDYAFMCDELESVSIPQTVPSVSERAFFNAAVKTVIVEEGDSTLITNGSFENSTITSLEMYRPISCTFSNWKSLSSLKIGGKITSISNKMFKSCSILKVEILNSVTSIGDSAFSGCRLTSIEIPNSVTSIGGYAFYGCTGLTSVEIPNSVTYIGGSAFSGCSGLTSVEIPNSVTSIGRNAFSDCRGLTGVYITDLEAWCKVSFYDKDTNPLYYARNLYLNDELVTNLVIPNSVKSIRNYVFINSSSLTSVEIPNSVTYIGGSAFSGCSGLTSVEIPNSVTSIGGSAFSRCSGLTSVEIPNSVTSLGNSAFSGCTGLTSVEISNSVTSIGDNAFSGCTGLTSVEISNSVTFIGKNAFSGCSGLTSVVVPGSVTEIGSSVFKDCSSLSDVVFIKGKDYMVYNNQNYGENFEGTSIKSLYWDRNTCALYWDEEKNDIISLYNPVSDVFNYDSENLTNLEKLTIGGTVKALYTYCINSPKLKELILESGDTDITFEISDYTVNPIEKLSINRNGTYNFSGITTLKELRVGSDIKDVTNGDFTAASALMNVYCTATTPPTGVTFSNDTYLDGTLYVKKGCKEAYEAADGWKQFWTIVDNLPFEVDGLWYQPQDDGTVMLVASPTGDSYADTVLVPATVTYEGVVYEVSSIAHDAFGNAVAATELKIEDSAKSLTMKSPVAMTTASTDDEMTGIFSTSRIEKVYVGRDLKYTVDNAPFASLTALKDVTVGANVTSMGGAMFAGCKNITSVSSYATVPPADAEFEEVVYSRASLNLLPDNSVLTAYKAAEGWKNFFTNGSDVSGIDDIRVDENNDDADTTDDAAEVEYYNLQGMKVNALNLSSGVYIKKQGKSTKKIFVK